MDEKPTETMVLRRGYTMGVSTGIVAGEVLALIALALFVVPSLINTYSGSGSVEPSLPALTRFALSRWWCWGAPIILTAAAGYANLVVYRPSRMLLVLGIALIGLGLLVATVIAYTLPLASSCGNC